MNDAVIKAALQAAYDILLAAYPDLRIYEIPMVQRVAMQTQTSKGSVSSILEIRAAVHRAGGDSHSDEERVVQDLIRQVVDAAKRDLSKEDNQNPLMFIYPVNLSELPAGGYVAYVGLFVTSFIHEVLIPGYIPIRRNL